MSERLLDLSAAEAVAQSRRADWERQGLTVEFRYWPPTCAQLLLSTPAQEGELLLWVSGEVDLAVGSSPEDVSQRHEHGVTAQTIGALMDELAQRLTAAR